MATTLEPSPTQPNIAYQPDLDSYQKRTKRRLATGDLPKELPYGFPTQLQSPLVWKGSDFCGQQDFVTVLTTEDLGEIKEALHHFKGDYVPMACSLGNLGTEVELIACSVARAFGEYLSGHVSLEITQMEAPKTLCRDAQWKRIFRSARFSSR